MIRRTKSKRQRNLLIDSPVKYEYNLYILNIYVYKVFESRGAL